MARQADTPETAADPAAPDAELPAQAAVTGDELTTIRGDAIAEIAAARNRRTRPAAGKTGEGEGDPGGEPGGEETPAEKAGGAEETEPPAAAAPDPAPEKTVAPDADPEIEISVNGQTRKMRQSEVAALAARSLAGDDALAMARQALDEVKQLSTKLAAPAPRADTGPDPGKETTDALAEFDWGKLVTTIQFEDPAQAGVALKEAVAQAVKSAGGGDAVAVEKIVREEFQRTTSQQQAQDAFTTAITEFGDRHPKIFEDGELGAFATNAFLDGYRTAYEKNRKEGSAMPTWHALLDESAERTYRFVERLGGDIRPSAPVSEPNPGAKTVVNLDTEKRARQKAESATPAGRGGVQRGAAPAAAPLTPDQIRQKAVQEAVEDRNRRKGIGS